VHTTVILGVAMALATLDGLPGTVRCVFQPAEETIPGGASEVVASGVLDGASRAFALHCDPSVPAGTIGLRTGAITAACDRIDITLTGPGGHTARPQLTVDLVDALGRLITDLPGLLSRQVDPRSGMSLVWGAVNAGIAANAIPQRGSLRGTVRVLDRELWKDAEDLMRSLVERVAATTGADCDVDYVRGLPPVVNDPRAVALMRAAALDTVGHDRVVVTPQSMGGEDFGWFAEVLPIALARLGTHGGGPPLDLHRGTFDVDERAIGIGVRVLARTALHALEADALSDSAGPPPPARARRPAPGDTSARRTVDERREPDDEFHRPADRRNG
jgi:amidohydrolase